MTPIEIIALVMIVLSLIKLTVFLISPKKWWPVVKFAYGDPIWSKVVYFILGVVVLYYLIQAGLTIVEIFAVMAFFGCLMAFTYSLFTGEILPCFRKMFNKKVINKSWIAWIPWIALIAWALYVIFG